MEKPLALLFVDIADSTQLYERIGNLPAATLTQAMLAHLRRIIETYGGTVIKSLGDGLLAAFPTADDSGRAALAMSAAEADHGLQLRVGIHFGPVIQGAEDVYGDACNVAARVEAIARPGEILVTDALADQLSPPLRRKAKPLSNVAVKGKAAPIRVHRLQPGEQEDEHLGSTTVGVSMPHQEQDVATLRLSHNGFDVAVNRFMPRLTIGREETSGLRVAARQTSRQHASLEFSRESFILTDHSSNGTFIRAGNSRPVRLLRDSTRLVGSGLLGFGAEPEDEGQAHVVAFRSDRK
ncbi:adenylate/guanylate cyclase domain-containing protein [Azospirillum sp. SYSU D00513]|uniref:adenylate/guanylate cyclase domain-containing protein n=1 Tax=Azospirillum sp. SYSU D00513 TaxID=2812561 RepID=UPI001A971709|nr:adenylate/guanylate cyclase domain-containing protein [Azospirillum sp. SYSU D00513]